MPDMRPSSVKPEIFNGPMVYAINEGFKTHTRRLLKRQPVEHSAGNWTWDARRGSFVGASGTHIEGFPRTAIVHCGYRVGDLLWVRETVRAIEDSEGIANIRYAADQHWEPIPDTAEAAERWVSLYGYRGKRGAPVPAIHMPRWVSRLTLEVTSVKVERLTDISHADAIAEGALCAPVDRELHGANARDRFAAIWEGINGEGSWGANPWIVAVSFKVHRVNVDAFLAQREAA